MPGDAWVYACRRESLRDGEGRRVQLPSGGKRDAVALFRHAGQFFALEDRCCHSDKSLHGGDIEDLGECVVSADGELGLGGVCVQCPRHQRKFAGGLYFNLETGLACTPEYTRKFHKLDKHYVRVHDVLVEEGCVYVSVKGHKFRPTKRQKTQDVVVEALEGSPGASGDRKRVPAESQGASSESLLCILDKVEHVNHDTLVFFLGHPKGAPLPAPPQSPIWHVTLSACIAGKAVERDYTPVSSWREWRDEGRIRLLIKIYADGVMTRHLAAQAPGSSIAVSAPYTTLLAPSLQPPLRTSAHRPFAHVVLFAAGSGVIPMLQILEVALHLEAAVRTVTLFCSNKSLADLLCWEEISSLAGRHVQPGTAPEFRAWLSFSSEGAGSDFQRGNFVEGVVHKRIDSTLTAQALAFLPGCEPVHVIISGPDGYFEGMRGVLPEHVRKAACFVNLDE